MIQFEDSEYCVIIEDGFVEAIIRTAQWWEERIKQDIEKLIIQEVVYQMRDDSKYIRFNFDFDADTARELDTCSNILSVAVRKKNVTLRSKWLKVRILEGSPYEGLNNDPEFIDALTKAYNTTALDYLFYLPVTYQANLVSKDENSTDTMGIHVDIPFEYIEVYK